MVDEIGFTMQFQANSCVLELQLPGVDWCRKEQSATLDNLNNAHDFLMPFKEGI